MRRRDPRETPHFRSPHRCGPTGKRRYKTAAGAMIDGASLVQSEAWKSNTVRAYLCQYCRGYHLTSKS